MNCVKTQHLRYVAVSLKGKQKLLATCTIAIGNSTENITMMCKYHYSYTHCMKDLVEDSSRGELNANRRQVLREASSSWQWAIVLFVASQALMKRRQERHQPSQGLYSSRSL